MGSTEAIDFKFKSLDFGITLKRINTAETY